MGFCGSKISGHSGTEFKHRKAFVSIKAYHEKTKYFKKSYSYNSNLDKIPLAFEARLKEGWLQKASRFSKIFLLISSIFFFIGIFSYKLYPLNKTDVLEEELNKAQEAATICGYEYLSENQLKLARKEFLDALAINEKEIKARVGLTKSLVLLCNRHEKYCEAAALNTKFVYDHKYVKVREIRSWFDEKT